MLERKLRHVVAAAAAALLLAPAAARIHSLTIKDDPRFVWSIESFGFFDGGKIDLALRGVSATPAGAGHRMGFVVFPTASVASYEAHVKYLEDSKVCALDAAPVGALVINVSDPRDWPFYSSSLSIAGGGMFDLLFTHCAPLPAAGDLSSFAGGAEGAVGSAGVRSGGEAVTVSFQLDSTFVNPGGNYLSAGDIPLPTVLGFMCAVFAVAAGLWVRWLRRNAADVHRVHHLMTLLVCVKCFQVMCEAIMYHYIAVTGHNSAWNVMFYIFSLLKTGIMVLVAVLVATGWSILRPFLTKREKTVLAVALWMQLLANTAIIVTDDYAPGSLVYLEWSYVFYLCDFVAAVAVVVPLHWHYKQLQQTYSSGSGTDTNAKAAETLARLSAMRSFYTWTVGYVYATRLLLWILRKAVTYRYSWVPTFLEEAITLAYYAYTGYKFRPSSENAYLRVAQDDDEDTGVGTEDVARATGAAAGAVEGASGAVQTISSTSRKGGADSVGIELTAAGAAAPSLAAAGAAAAKGKIAIGAEEEDEDFGLDDLDEDDAPAPAPAPKASAMRQVPRPM